MKNSIRFGKGRTGSVKRIAFVISGFLVMLLTACGGNPTNTAAPDGGHVGDSTCFSQMEPQDRQQLEEYVRKNGDTTKTVDSNPDGTQDVCVLEREGDGSYEEHYYKQEDHFGDYLMYSMLLGNSNALMTAGLINGDLSVSDYVALKLLTGVGDDGRAYHPYTRNGDGSYVRQKTVINNINVTHVHYGSTKPIDLKAAKTQKPPAGYEAKPTLKANTNPSIKRGGLGVPGATNGYTPKPTTASTKPAAPPQTTQAPKKCSGATPLGTWPNCKARPTTRTKTP